MASNGLAILGAQGITGQYIDTVYPEYSSPPAEKVSENWSYEKIMYRIVRTKIRFNMSSLRLVMHCWNIHVCRITVNLSIYLSIHISWYYIQHGNLHPAKIPQCTSPITHNAAFCNGNVHRYAHFCYKRLHCGMFIWCIIGFWDGILRRLNIDLLLKWMPMIPKQLPESMLLYCHLVHQEQASVILIKP